MAISTVFPHDFGLLSPATLHPPSRSQKETQKNTKRIGTSFGTMWNTLWPMTKNVPSAISTREIQRYRDVSGRSAGDEATAISCMCKLYEQVRVKASWPTSIKHRQSHGLPKSWPSTRKLTCFHNPSWASFLEDHGFGDVLYLSA